MTWRLNLRSFTILLAGLLTVLLFISAGDVLAKGRGRHHSEERHSEHRHSGRHYFKSHNPYNYNPYTYNRYNRYGRVIVTSPTYYPGTYVDDLPRGYSSFTADGRPYYYDEGAYYYGGTPGYVVVGPPIGSVVPGLPLGYGTFWANGLLYYYYGNVFYRRVPSGYMVVLPPPTATVVLKEPVVEKPAHPASGRVSVIAARLNVRTGPSLTKPILYQVKETSTLKVHGRTKDWLYVKLPNGKYGWVMEKFVVQMDIPASG